MNVSNMVKTAGNGIVTVAKVGGVICTAVVAIGEVVKETLPKVRNHLGKNNNLPIIKD